MACNPSIVISGPGTTDSVSNSGKIDCIVVTDGAVVKGDIRNEPSGEIGDASVPPEAGIVVDGATVGGAIVNHGTINASGAAVSVKGASVVAGGIINDPNATIRATGAGDGATGIAVSGPVVTGGIVNTGTISATGGKGRAVGIFIGGAPRDGDRRSGPRD